MVRTVALDPDFVFDSVLRPLDDRIVEGIGRIRKALLAPDFLSGRASAERYQDVLVIGIQLLAFIGASDAEAVSLAYELADQLQGSEVEVHAVISGIDVMIEAGEPVDDMVDTTVIYFNGDAIITIENCRTVPVDVDADWDRLIDYAHLTSQA